MENEKTGQEKTEFYEAPRVKVKKIVIEQNILQFTMKKRQRSIGCAGTNLAMLMNCEIV